MGRSVLLNLFKLAFDRKASEVKASENAPIVVFRLDGKLGDSITSTGFLNELKLQNPKSDLVIVTNEIAAHVYKELPFVSRIVIGKKGFLSTLKIYSQLKDQTYKYLINTSYILKPQVVFLSSWLSAEIKLTWENHNYRLFNKHVDLKFSDDHVTDFYRKTLKSLELNHSNVNLDYRIILPLKSKEKIQKELKPLKEKYSKIAVLNSFAGARLRNLNFERTLEIVKFFKDLNIAVISIANKGDQQILEAWQNKSKDLNNWFVFKDLNTLNDSFSFIEESDLVVSPDTAVVHAACALNKKLIAIYREDTGTDYNFVNWSPKGTQFKIVKSPVMNGVNDINSYQFQDFKKSVEVLLNE